jgi:Ca2+-binding RTX toxin-like protein
VKTLPRGRTRRFSTGLILSLLFGLTSAPIVRAATPTMCTFDAGSATATVTVTQGVIATISREGDTIAVDGFPCQTATVTNTDVIDVAVPDVPESDIVVVDLSGGPLAPGATDEGDGSSEIEIDVSGIGGSFDTLRVVGSDGPDALAAGFLSVSLNADEATFDEDVTLTEQHPGVSLELLGGEGDDLLSLADPGTPLNAFGPKTLSGGPGDDRVIGDGQANTIDAGPGHDIADYSWTTQNLNLVWEAGTATLSFDAPPGDELNGVEEVVLTDSLDTITYVGASTGETWAGAYHDEIVVVDPVAGGSASDRVIHGGSGVDRILFDTSADAPLSLELTRHTIGGSWAATYSWIEYVIGEDGDDRFRITERGTYPTILGGDGTDVLAFRRATEGINVTLGKPTFEPRTWIEAFEIEQVLGSDFNDVFLGPSGAGGPVQFFGFSGRDDLRGGEGPDLLVGGEGQDTLRGFGGADTLKGGPGDDACDGGPGADTLTGC